MKSGWKTKRNEADFAQETIDEAFALDIETKKINPIRVEKELSIIALVGENMKTSHGSCGHFGHGGLWFDPIKRMVSSKTDFLIK